MLVVFVASLLVFGGLDEKMANFRDTFKYTFLVLKKYHRDSKTQKFLIGHGFSCAFTNI
jgi:hypothetical protein